MCRVCRQSHGGERTWTDGCSKRVSCGHKEVSICLRLRICTRNVSCFCWMCLAAHEESIRLYQEALELIDPTERGALQLQIECLDGLAANFLKVCDSSVTSEQSTPTHLLLVQFHVAHLFNRRESSKRV